MEPHLEGLIVISEVFALTLVSAAALKSLLSDSLGPRGSNLAFGVMTILVCVSFVCYLVYSGSQIVTMIADRTGGG
jgi:hypothetical protein